MTWLIFTFISLFLTVAYGLIAKSALSRSSNLDPIAYASAMFLFVGVITFIIYLIQGVSPTEISFISNPKMLLLLGTNLIIYTIAPSLYYRAVKNLPFSIVAIVYSLSGLFAILIELIFRISTFSLPVLIGSTLIVASVVLVSFKNEELSKKKYLLAAILATLFYSFAAILDHQLSAGLNSSLYMSLTFGIPAFLILLFNRTPLSKIKETYRIDNYKFAAINGFMIATSFYFIFQAYKYGGSASHVYSVLSLDAVLTVLAAAIFLRERNNLLIKFIAAVIASFGVYLLTK